MQEDKDFAMAFANLKGPKDKDLMGTARALQRLKGMPAYNTNAKLGKVLDVSAEIIREFLTLLDLPEETHALFETYQLRLEHGRRLWQLRRTRPELVDEASQAMVGLTVMDSRDLVEYILNHAETTVEEAKQTVLASKTIIEREIHVVAILEEVNYLALAKVARDRRIPIDELVTEIVNSWVAAQGNHSA